MPGSSNKANSICFNSQTNLDIANLAGHVKECKDDQVCMFQSFKNELIDARLEKTLVIRRCLDEASVPQYHQLGICDSEKITNTSTHKKECYCKADLCNKDQTTVDKPTTTTTITTTTSTSFTSKSITSNLHR